MATESRFQSGADRTLPAVGAPVVQRVLLCELLGREARRSRRASRSLPGHLIQLMVTGRTAHEVGGRQHTLEPGHLIWYHEDELVWTHVREAPWSFYTVNFLAPTLPPPAFDQRVHKVGAPLRRCFETLHGAWHDKQAPHHVRELRVHAAMHGLLAQVLGSLGTHTAEPFAMDESARLWWQIEQQLRRDLSIQITLSTLAKMSGRSAATIARACHAAVGQPPMRRVKQIRLGLAQGLVRRSDLTMAEIAARIGYPRPHEFSRDYRKHFGVSPRRDRREQP